MRQPHSESYFFAFEVGPLLRAAQAGGSIRVSHSNGKSGQPRAWDLVFAALVTAVVSTLLAWPFVDVSLGGDHYVHLSRHLARGDLTVDGLSDRYGDVVRWGGHTYLPFGPLPAILLIPFLPLLDNGMPLVAVSYSFTLVNVVVFHRILQDEGVGREQRRWTTLLYFAGTSYLGITLVGISTYFAHVVASTFLLLAMLVAGRTSKQWKVGLLLGAGAAARLTIAFAIAGFLHRFRDRRQLSLVAGFAVPLLGLAAYNYFRFGSIAETGFGRAVLYEPVLEQARSAGMFSLAHVPKNFFFMLLKGPEIIGGDSTPVLSFPYLRPSAWGMGLFFTSPALLYAFRAPFSERRVRGLWLGTLSVMVPLMLYYGIGYVQFGYRYALDFMPLLALLAALGMPEPMTNRARLLVSLSVVICVWGAIHLATWI